MADDTKQATAYRERAAQIRAAAQLLSDPETAKAALGVAYNYEQLAKWLEDAQRLG